MNLLEYKSLSPSKYFQSTFQSAEIRFHQRATVFYLLSASECTEGEFEVVALWDSPPIALCDLQSVHTPGDTVHPLSGLRLISRLTRLFSAATTLTPTGDHCLCLIKPVEFLCLTCFTKFTRRRTPSTLHLKLFPEVDRSNEFSEEDQKN